MSKKQKDCSDQNLNQENSIRGRQIAEGSSLSSSSSASSALILTGTKSPGPDYGVNPIIEDPLLDTCFIVLHKLSAWEAFLQIADILEIRCGRNDAVDNIGTAIFKLPQPLIPTLQQQIIPHKAYIDMLPWCTLRDRVLEAQGTINELEFVSDMSSSDIKVWGTIPYDTTGWEIGPKFAKKWWFLLDAEILRTTNFWRGQRGEPPLVLGQLSVA